MTEFAWGMTTPYNWNWKRYPTIVIAWPYYEDSERYVNVPLLAGQKHRYSLLKENGVYTPVIEVQYTRDELQTVSSMFRAMLMARQGKLNQPRSTLNKQANEDYFHLSNDEFAAAERTWATHRIPVHTVTGEQVALL